MTSDRFVVEQTTFHGPFNRFRVECIRSLREGIAGTPHAVQYMVFDAERIDDVTGGAACVGQFFSEPEAQAFLAKVNPYYWSA